MKINILLLFAALILVRCKAKNDPNDTLKNLIIVDMSVPEVETEVIKKYAFNKELVSNGKLSALQKVELAFRVNNQRVEKIKFQNGDRVKTGDLIAYLDNYELEINFNTSKRQFERTKLDFAEVLIGLGYSISDTNKIARNVLESAKLRSGFSQAEANYELAKYNYEGSKIIAPIDGEIANLFTQEKNFPQNGVFCTLLDNSKFIVDFPIMESELLMIQKEQKVLVSPYYNPNIKVDGYVKLINPVVSVSGLVRIQAIIANVNNSLYDGMNVKVSVKQNIKAEVSVPKSAVTIRSDKEVVFTLKNGIAYWNNVILGPENSERYIIEDGLKVGDTIITKGNIHLANLTKVKSVSEYK